MKLSVVIPVYNEVDNIVLLHKAIHQALKSVKYSWEMILVDDGSTDKSPEELEKLARKDPKFVRVVLLRRNFGQTTAIAAGIDQARGRDHRDDGRGFAERSNRYPRHDCQD